MSLPHTATVYACASGAKQRRYARDCCPRAPCLKCIRSARKMPPIAFPCCYQMMMPPCLLPCRVTLRRYNATPWRVMAQQPAMICCTSRIVRVLRSCSATTLVYDVDTLYACHLMSPELLYFPFFRQRGARSLISLYAKSRRFMSIPLSLHAPAPPARRYGGDRSARGSDDEQAAAGAGGVSEKMIAASSQRHAHLPMSAQQRGGGASQVRGSGESEF